MYVKNSKGGKILLGIKAGGRMKNKILKFYVITFALMFSTHLMFQMEKINVEASDSGLVGYWSFDEGSGSIVNDVSGYGNDGTIYGATWTNGKIGKSLDFDGVNDYVEILDSSNFDFAYKSFSWEFWIKRDMINDYQAIINQGIEQNNKAFLAGFRPDNTFTFAFWYNDLDTSSSYLNSDTWHHWVGTYDADSNTRILYRDGESIAQGIASNDYQGDGNVYIGGGGNVWSYGYFGGQIDEVRLYNRVISAEEAQQHYQGNFGEVVNQQPTVVILEPDDGDIISRTTTVSGTASDSDGSITKVELRIDSGSWFSITGTTSWSYSWNTESVEDGSHTIYARSYDGEDYSDIQSIIISISNSAQPSEEGLVGYWSFDEGSGSIVNDASAYGNDGTIYGASWTNGKIGKALNFDGVNDYVEVPDDNSLDLSTMTLEAWIYLETEVGDTTNQNRIIEHREKQAKAYGLEIFAKDYYECTGDQLVIHTTLNFNIRNTVAPTHINTYQWYHVVGTFDGEYQKLYINGVLDKIGTKITGITSDISGPVLFGTESKENCFFDGIIDEVRIYNRALSADDIYQHYLGNFGEIDGQKPQVTILNPDINAVVANEVTISGIASDIDGTVKIVQIKIDEGSWVTAAGTSSWTYSLDTDMLDDGSHTIYARSYDGNQYSDIDSVTFNVQNSASGDSINETPGFSTGVAVAAVGIGALVAFFRRRRN